VLAGALLAELIASASGHARDLRQQAKNPDVTPLREMFEVTPDGRLVERFGARWPL